MKTKKATIWHACIPMFFLIGGLISTLQFWKGEPHIPILFAAITGAATAMFFLGMKWKVLEEGVVDTIKMAMGAILILLVIGIIIGTWILSGIVPTMIYWGLKLLSPSIFLVATCLICSVVSISTGSSWTTVGTVGVALIGIGAGMGMPLGLVAGAIISGSYFGDKMSPLSDTTNLAPAMVGAKLFEHIRHMLYTTGPSYLISLVLFGIIGFTYAGKSLDTKGIDLILTGLEKSFNLSPFLFLAPVILIGMVIKKIPALPSLMTGAIIGGLFAWIFQGTGMTKIIAAAHHGYVSETNIKALDDLLSRGGLSSMMGTISLILIAMTFGGIMVKSGMLQAVADQILRFATSTGNLVLSTILTIIAMNLLAGDQYLSIVVPGRMYKNMFDDRNLHPKNLSRILEDAGTLTSPLVPWNTCGLFMASTLGVATVAYLPFAFLNLLNPIVSILYGYTGITMEKIDTKETEEKKETKETKKEK